MNHASRNNFGPGDAFSCDQSMTRRHFVKSIAATGVAVSIGARSWAAESRSGDMIYRTMGRTGEKISALGLGGFHIGVPRNEEEGIRIIRSAIDRGFTFMDNCSFLLTLKLKYLQF